MRKSAKKNTDFLKQKNKPASSARSAASIPRIPLDDPEITWRMQVEYHIGFILADKKKEKIIDLLENHDQRIFANSHASNTLPKHPI